MDFDLLREWVRAEIEYEIASREEGSDGYRQSAGRERDEVYRLFNKLKGETK